MLALKIADADVKDFMNKLLREEVFDNFEVHNIIINSFAKFDISGGLYYADDTASDKKHTSWQKLQPYVFNIIKGNKRPEYMKFVFFAGDKMQAELSETKAVYFLNIIFENKQILVTSAVMVKEFTLDRSQEYIWDTYVANFFKKHKIAAIASI